jgi:hypothetical protein
MILYFNKDILLSILYDECKNGKIIEDNEDKNEEK